MKIIDTFQHHYIRCPNCNQGEFRVTHLVEDRSPRSFGPWKCRVCNHSLSGVVKNKVEITKIDPPVDEPQLCLMRFRDMFLVVDSYTKWQNGKSDWYDFLFHSHQCPTNMLRHVLELYDVEYGSDPHGTVRFVASIPDTEHNRKLLEGDLSIQQLFVLFATDGQDAPSQFPPENEGLIPWLAELRREYQKTKTPKA
jgi:hypothetical protein